MNSKNKYYGMDTSIEELEEDLRDLKCMFNEKSFLKTRKKEKKFKNKIVWEQ